MRLLHCIFIVFLLAIGATSAEAVTHLVSPGDRWGDISHKVQPGDEIMLMPGKHRAATLIDIRGTEDAPIRISSLDPDRPAVINGDRFGIALRRCRFVIIENLLIDGARQTGILMDDGDNQSMPPWMNERPSGHHIVRDVAINRIGDTGARHAITIRAQRDVLIDGCAMQGWGGAGIWIGHSELVRITSCRFRRLREFAHDIGIYICGGTIDVNISHNYFDDPGTYGVKIGHRLRGSEFGGQSIDDAEPGTLFDARKVTIENNVFRGTECAISMSHLERCVVRANTIDSPRQIVFSLMHNHVDARFAGHVRTNISGNLINVRETPTPRAVVVLNPMSRAEVTFGVNLWWSPDIDTWREAIARLPIEDSPEQTTTLDPELDVAFVPQRDDAQIFGAPSRGLPIEVRAVVAPTDGGR